MPMKGDESVCGKVTVLLIVEATNMLFAGTCPTRGKKKWMAKGWQREKAFEATFTMWRLYLKAAVCEPAIQPVL